MDIDFGNDISYKLKNSHLVEKMTMVDLCVSNQSQTKFLFIADITFGSV